MKPTRLLLLLVILVPPATATAQFRAADAAPESSARHHRGFFLRLDAGMGYMGTSTSPGGVSASIQGASSQFGVAVGGAIVENVMLAGEVWGRVSLFPSSTINGVKGLGTSGAALVGIGPHFTFYVMPANVYLSLTPALTLIALNLDGDRTYPKPGFGAKVALGKEWWVGGKMSIGVAGQFTCSFNQDENTSSSKWSSYAGGLSFSATMH